jgi:hypothetical protein
VLRRSATMCGVPRVSESTHPDVGSVGGIFGGNSFGSRRVRASRSAESGAGGRLTTEARSSRREQRFERARCLSDEQ